MCMVFSVPFAFGSRHLENCLTGGRSNQRPFVHVLHLSFLNTAVVVPIRLVFPMHYPTPTDGLHLMPQFGGVPTCTSRAMLNSACFSSALTDFSIVHLSVILPNKNQIMFDFKIYFCARTQASASRATTVGAAANGGGDRERSES